MPTDKHSLAYVVALISVLFVQSASAQGGPPVTTGATVSSKPWVPSQLAAAPVLPVVTGGTTASTKPWLVPTGVRRAAGEEAFLGLGAGVSSKPWIPSQRVRVEIGPLAQIALSPWRAAARNGHRVAAERGAPRQDPRARQVRLNRS